MTRTIGLSGGIGTGKSTVASMWRELGATVIDADAIVHELQAPGAPLLHEIREAFGPEVFDAHGALDRRALAARVFGDPAERERLNAIVHPAVRAEMARRIEAARASGAPLVVLDIPLLFEGQRGGERGPYRLDATVLVYAPRALQIERTMARDGSSQEEAERRIAAQMPIEEKRALADHVIENIGSLDSTRAQVAALHRKLLAD